MPKQPRVPETREPKPNREQRRHPDLAGRAQGGGVPHVVQQGALQGSQDVSSVRAKNSGHGKKTADKWNQ